MSVLITLLADILVAVLLVATIATSVRLSRRIAQLKGDEAALRQTIGDLMIATSSAERAIGSLRSAVDESDRMLAERLETASACAAGIAAQVAAGETVLARIGAIVGEARSAARPAAPPSPAPTPVQGAHSDRLGAAAAASLAMTERALQRVRNRAA
ncbi:DUF6468 domain-containing protein [Methylobacterium symbioticum]|uniref:DUF6468 domain-containing protein n=1 Tax=Methylobacterium symbioticum TaxID=2584084 RepID=A0A509E5W8_9HYPH|nr:DUF6468 domain-containing protein [Methylobacterium symbioticum]VUD69472.1 hypothetical protein MET9862_00020 [Methylobacterium symbioticum]